MSDHNITDHRTIKAFALAGNARFTLVSNKTGQRFTYRVRKAERGNTWFVSVLTGSDNQSDYTFIGNIWDNGYRHSQKSTISAKAPSVVAFEWFARHINHTNVGHALQFWHEGRCGKCARPLTDPSSIESGFGPECIKSIAC